MSNVIGNGGLMQTGQPTAGTSPFGNWKRPPILDKLKSETDSRHVRLQQNSIFNGLLGKEPPLDRYKTLLERFWGFYGPVENKLGENSEWQARGFNFEERRKTHLIERDLAHLGTRETGDLALCNDLPEIESFEQALGCMYVLEGATLGAQQMARNFKMERSLDENTGCAFLRCYGEGPLVGMRFKAFADFLGANYAQAKEAEVIEAAKATFDKLDVWLSS